MMATIAHKDRTMSDFNYLRGLALLAILPILSFSEAVDVNDDVSTPVLPPHYIHISIINHTSDQITYILNEHTESLDSGVLMSHISLTDPDKTMEISNFSMNGTLCDMQNTDTGAYSIPSIPESINSHVPQLEIEVSSYYILPGCYSSATWNDEAAS